MNNIHFTDEDWARVQRDTIAWWNGELQRPLVYLASTGPVDRPSPYGYQSNYPLDMPAEAVIDLYAPFLEARRFYADAFPWVWLNFGPGIVAGFLGTQINSVTDPSETVWFTPSQNVPVGELDLRFDSGNPWWLRVQELSKAWTERYGGMVQVSHTDLGGNLDILASLVTTEQLLFDVVEQPEEVLRQVHCITDLWLRYYDVLDRIIRGPGKCPGTSAWTPIWSPGTTYMLQCDFSYMISPKMFERFVMPDLVAICDHLDHGFYHLDGKGEIPHLDLLLSLERLRGIQWISGDGQPTPDQWLPLLKRIRDGGKLCQIFVTPEGARHVVKNLGGKGFLFVVSDDDKQFNHPEVAEAFLNTLAQEDISLAR